MFQLVRFVFIVILLSSIPSSQAMELAVAKKTTSWPCELYNNAFLGASYAPPPTRPLEEEIAYAQTLQRGEEAAKNTPWAQGIAYDWIYTLEWAEQSLVHKPFITWTIEDVQAIASHLSRLTDANAATFRKDHEHRILRDLKAEEKESYLANMATFARELLARADTTDPQQFKIPDFEFPFFAPEGYVYRHARPAAIKGLVLKALTRAQQDFAVCRYLPTLLDRAEECARVGGEFAFQLISIRPFRRAHMRLGAVIMFILLRQAQLRPISPKSRSAYIKTTYQCLVENSGDPLIRLWKEIFTIAKASIIPRYYDFQAGRSLAPTKEPSTPSTDELTTTEELDSTEEEINEELDSTEENPEALIAVPGKERAPAENRFQKDEDGCASTLAMLQLLSMKSLEDEELTISIPLCDHPECKERIQELGEAIGKVLNMKMGQEAPAQKVTRYCSGCFMIENGVLFKCCSRCKKAFYCNEQCQRSHWASHKSDCKTCKI